MLDLCLVLAAISAIAGYQGPRPELTQTFGEWVVGCGNERFCRAVGLAQEDDAPPLSVTIWRNAGPTAAPIIEFDLVGLPHAPLCVDGTKLPPEDREEAPG